MRHVSPCAPLREMSRGRGWCSRKVQQPHRPAPTSQLGHSLAELTVAVALSDGHPSLSERDEMLLEFLSHGLTEERIGEQLHLSSETVRANIRKVVRSLGARNRAHAVALALKTGVIQ